MEGHTVAVSPVAVVEVEEAGGSIAVVDSFPKVEEEEDTIAVVEG